MVATSATPPRLRTRTNAMLVLVSIMLALFALSVPIAFALGIAALPFFIGRGLPLIAIPQARRYHRALREMGKEPLPVGVHSPGHIADTDEEAKEQLWPHYFEMRKRIGGERGWPPPTRAQFDQEAGPRGALYVGAPETPAADASEPGHRCSTLWC